MDEKTEPEEPFRGYKRIMESGDRPSLLIGIKVVGTDETVRIYGRSIKLRVGDNTRFKNLEFVKCSIEITGECVFENCQFKENTILERKSGKKLKLSGCFVHDSILSNVDTVHGGEIENCSGELDARIYDGTTFKNCVLNKGGTPCRQKKFIDVRFSGGEIGCSRFQRCEFTGCSFWNVEFSSSTKFDACKFAACKMSRLTWYTLPPQAGLTIANKLEINVSDPIENLRRNFTGINSILHWIFLTVFLAPYVAFVSWQWFKHLMYPAAGDEALLFQLLKFILSGGESNQVWQLNYFSFGIFCLYVAYNACRAALLWKMLKIETEMRIKGVPGRMELVGSKGWKRVEKVLEVARWLTIPLVVFNTLNFLMTKTPY